jgi:hypothetical protein
MIPWGESLNSISVLVERETSAIYTLGRSFFVDIGSKIGQTKGTVYPPYFYGTLILMRFMAFAEFTCTGRSISGRFRANRFSLGDAIFIQPTN